MPTRTLQRYTTDGLVVPSIVWPEKGVLKPMYCLADVFRARVLWEIGELGVPHRAWLAAARDLASFSEGLRHLDEDEPLPFPAINLEALAEWSPLLMLAHNDEIVDQLLAGHPDKQDDCEYLSWQSEENAEECGEELDRVAYWLPLAPIAVELKARADAWFEMMPESARTRPPWL
jgi:hypothetical protein